MSSLIEQAAERLAKIRAAGIELPVDADPMVPVQPSVTETPQPTPLQAQPPAAVLSKQVQFQKLGLVIVDEEQHFGVGQKEKLTQQRVIKLFTQGLGYRYLGDWKDLANNRNIEESILGKWLGEPALFVLIDRTLHCLNKATRLDGDLA